MACSRRRRRREDGAGEREVATGPRLGRRSFFKIILSDALESGKLAIPKSFLRRCGKVLSNSVLLKVPGGSTWTIELEKCKNDMVLLWKGWREFMERYSIGHGHLLVFKYRGNSTLRVIIFNKSASEIDYSSSGGGKTSYLRSELPSPETEDLEDVTPHRRIRREPYLPYSQLSPSYSPRGSEGATLHFRSHVSSEIDYSLSNGKTAYLGSKLPSPETEDVVETEDLEDVTPHWRMRSEPHLPYSQLSPSYSPRGSEVPIDTDHEEPHLCQPQAGLTDRIKQPTCRMSHSELVCHGPTLPRPLTTPELAHKVDSEHPFFKKVIRRCCMDKLYIPGGFIKQHIQEKQRATLMYANRSWSVRLVRCNRRVRGALFLYFSAGWSAFVRDTHLCIGNVCVFKLIDRTDIVFEVSILNVQRRNKLSKQRVNHYELAFHSPTPPKPLNTPELASEFESEHPFFKVVIQQRHERQVYVPGQFAKQHIQENKEMATLRFSDKSWPVRLLSYSHETRVYFSAGWPAFARATHLCVGNICVFELIDRDDVVFKVSVYSSAGGIKKPRCRASHSGLDFHGPTLSKALKSPDLASNIDSEHPFFILATPPYYINCLGVPAGFAKQNLQEHKQIATLQYLDRSWPVKIVRNHRQATGTTTLSFSAGWRAFARETHLRAGNVCLFELINSDDTLFKVSIASGADNDRVHSDQDEHQKYYLRSLQHWNDSQGS